MTELPPKYKQNIKKEITYLPITIIFIVLSFSYPTLPLFLMYIVYKIGELYYRYHQFISNIIAPDRTLTPKEYEQSRLLAHLSLVIAMLLIFSDDSSSKTNNSIEKSFPDRVFEYVYTKLSKVKQIYDTFNKY